MTKARTETFAHAITALLSRREEMVEEAAQLRERQGVIANDIEALDRTLEQLGYAGDVKLTPRVPRVVLFYRGELRQFILAQLRDNGARTSRQMAEALITIEGKDARDRRLMADVVRRIGKACRQMKASGLVEGERGRSMGEFIWRNALVDNGA